MRCLLSAHEDRHSSLQVKLTIESTFMEKQKQQQEEPPGQKLSTRYREISWEPPGSYREKKDEPIFYKEILAKKSLFSRTRLGMR